jgi:pyridinium-3,5-bisthiocarboxylic acid mononucleotide nickel chelatase
MKKLYLDIFSGISGDMLVGALIDLGVGLDQIELEIGKLDLTGFHLHATRSQNSHIQGIKFDVHIQADHPHEDHSHADHHHHHHHHHQHSREHTNGHRDFALIRQLIERSTLSSWVKDKSVAVFKRIAVAEGKIHGVEPDKVHFHEVGAIDSIVDIVGACVALDLLGRPRVASAPVVDGTGWVDCAHGRFPVPTAATLEILGARGIALTQCDEPQELVTPTGAALLAEFAEEFGPMTELAPSRIGYGLGTRENKTRPNVLRAILCESSPGAISGGRPQGKFDWETDTITVLDTNIDDCTAEILGYVAEQALAAGAMDVFHTPVQMKKNRPGVQLTILCATSEADKLTELLLRETSAFGVRRQTAERRKLRRELTVVRTPFGEVTAKLGLLNGAVLQAAPEYESCKRVAATAQVPLKAVYEAATKELQLKTART